MTWQGFFAAESRALKRLADVIPGRGALTLLGAPMLAVVATFCLQPKAVGSEPSADFPAPSIHLPRASEPRVRPSPAYENTEPFKSLIASLEARDFVRARELLARDVHATQVPLARAFEVMVDCLETPSNDATAHAFRYYLEHAPAEVRPRLRAACLATP